MEKILGIDLGTNSIGWAIREVNNELENQIIDKGVLTFDKGVAEDKSGEHPMVQKRTEARGKRRNYQAEKYRKWELLECLIHEQMCPLTIDELNEWRHYTKGIGRKYPKRKEFIDWLRFDFDGDGKPDFERFGLSKHESYYIFRKLIIDEDKTGIFREEPYIIGRVLYQLVQRRGYNDGDNIDENDKDELSKTIMKGGGEAGAIGVDDILPYIEKYKTLGAALYQLQKDKNTRIRKRYNLRSHFKNEIAEICRVQSKEHIYKTLSSAITWQRPLRSQKGLVGVCTFEQTKRRCPISHPLYEEYRTWVFINNLKIKPIIENDIKINKLPLREALQTIVYPQFFKAASDFKLSSISKELKKVGFEITARFPEDTKVISLSFLYKMRDIFGDDWSNIIGWSDLLKGTEKNTKYDIEDLWHLHFVKTDNKVTGESAFEFIKRFAKDKLELKEDKAEAFSKIRLQQGYATLSLNAIKKILPYLHEGFIYSEAVYLANLPKVMGKKKLNEGDIEIFAEIIREVIKNDKQETRKIGIINSLITQYFEDKTRFETNKVKLVEEQIIEAFGKATWDRFSAQTQINIEDEIQQEINSFLVDPKRKQENNYKKVGRLHDKIFLKLMDDYGIPAENIKYLWHPSEQETYLPAKSFQKVIHNGKSLFIDVENMSNFLLHNPNATAQDEVFELLGNPEPISKGFKNPMALKTLYKLKRLINYLIQVGKIDKETRIVIEIARELNDANRRKAIERWQREREKQNEEFKKRIDEINKECKTTFDKEDKTLIEKIRLWEEQNKTCIYTGKTIGLCDILDGNKYDFEHSIPASMSFDNELKNLTISDKRYNQQIKGKKLPTECPNYENEYSHNGTIYPPIISTMQLIFGPMTETEKKIKGKLIKIRRFEKIQHLEDLYAEWKAKTSEDKQTKDNIIIKRHTIKMDLDYWRYKLRTFTDIEYKAGWRNSQLRDTQTITKYALPFLKTIFKKIEVQRGNITSDFRKIYKVQPRLEKKERTKHSHHAIDAAVLTLIPPAAIRDKILFRYNEAKDNQQGYHEKPRQWDNFHQQHIIGIENEVLINYQAQHRTLTPTYKTVRKRGEIQYVKQKLENGKWQYKLDKDGNKISLKASGKSIRGQLHKLSNFGAIKNKGELNLVERYPISSFTSINDCKHIVDDAVRLIVKSELERRMEQGNSFDKAKLDPIQFPSGKEVIKKVRCKVAAGRGYLTPMKALEIHKHDFESNHDYKQNIYVQNDQNLFCLYYEKETEKQIERAFRIIGLFEFSKLNYTNELSLYNDSYYNKFETGKGKNKLELPLRNILKAGTKVICYKDNIEELKDLDFKEILQRTFRIYKFNETGAPLIFLQNQIEARSNDKLGDGETIFNFNIYQPRLKLVANNFKVAIENEHFYIKIDGEINWKI
jgi:CRISPR-associated endonuclease Csn1